MTAVALASAVVTPHIPRELWVVWQEVIIVVVGVAVVVVVALVPGPLVDLRSESSPQKREEHSCARRCGDRKPTAID